MTGCDVKTWTPALSCKVPDHIISSQFASKKVFVPSYEKERRPCIEQLLTNEYQRIWWQEKELWDKRYSRKICTKKLLQRTVIKRKPPLQTALADVKPTKNRKPKKKIEPKTEEVIEKLKEDKDVKVTAEQETTEEEPDNKCDNIPDKPSVQ
ncbi:uncharacterized protein LOC143149330 [Ptiloglossa arizonensis]|uniref:uncharacterized protein LOC143149330 n=1 Tax=Ptiloglossa arizonensis TaxID=3350558 RepID=UPI003F9FF11B